MASHGFTPSVTAVHTSGSAGFCNHHFGKLRQHGLQPLPDPAREVFAGWIFQSRNFVEITVIQRLEHRREGLFQFGEIHDPATARSGFAAYVNLYAERMPVQPAALVAGRQVRQPVGRLDAENLKNLQWLPTSTLTAGKLAA